MENTFSVYHACREKDKYDYTVGYIGVSGDVEQRIRAHKTPKGTRGKTFSEAKETYNDIIYYVIYQGTRDACYGLEKILRPEINIGWNMFAGGEDKAKGYSTSWSESAKESITGFKSKIRKGIFTTPDGEFPTCTSAAIHHKVSKSTIISRCKRGGIIGRSKHHPREYWGNTWEELGWNYKEEV